MQMCQNYCFCLTPKYSLFNKENSQIVKDKQHDLGTKHNHEFHAIPSIIITVFSGCKWPDVL